METIETVAKKLGIELTEHQKKMLPAIEWLASVEPPPEKRGRTTILVLLAIARAMNRPGERLNLVFHEALWGQDVPERHIRRVTGNALMDVVEGKTRLLGGDFTIDDNGKLKFVLSVT